MSPIHQLAAALKERGLELWLDGGNLGYRAPKGVLTPADIAELRRRKPELIEMLRASASSAPMSFAQQQLWFLYRLNGPDAAYNIAAQYELEGPLDPAALQSAFEEIGRRHETFRTTFAEQDGQPVRVISAQPHIAFELASVASVGEAMEIARQEAGRRFLLTEAPLFRVKLLRLAPERHILLLTAHHIIADGWTLGILFQELSALYRCFRRGEPSSLPPVARQYSHYVNAQPASFDVSYWRTHLEGAQTLLDLYPPHAQTPGSEGAIEPVRIEPEVAQAFKQICRASGATPFMGMLAAFSALIARYTGRRDLVLGSQFAGRTRSEFESIAGLCVNTLPLRCHVDPTQSFRQLLESLKPTVLEAAARQSTPFDKIVEAVQPERSPGRNPLVQVMLLWQNLAGAGLELDGLRVATLPGVERTHAKFDLTLEMGERDGSFEGVLEYRTGQYTRPQMQRLARHIETLVRHIAAAPTRPLGGAEFTTAEERRRLRSLSQGPRAATEPQAIPARFEAIVRQHPNAPAVVYGETTLTYAELDARATRLAAYLLSQGVQPETPVALFLDPSAELLIAILGVLKAGAAYLPLDTANPKSRLAQVLQDAQSPVILTLEPLAGLLPPTPAQTVFLDCEIPSAPPAAPRPVNPGALAYVIYTSGSTGTPKGVMVEHSAVGNLADWLQRDIFAPLGPALRIALIAPPVFDASVQQIFGALLNGHTLYPVSREVRRNGPELWNFFHRHQIDAADCTPSLLSVLNDAGVPSSLSLRCLLVGGEALPAALAQQIGARISVHNVYGPTECCVDSTSLTVPRAPLAGKITPIGRPIPNAETYILDEAGNPVPEGLPGDIYIAGAGLGRGYWRQPALTAAAFVPHPHQPGARLYRTGDAGYWNGAGEIEFLGRTDDQVKVRGHRIQLGDIEANLARHPAVRQVAVTVHNGELIAYLTAGAAVTAAQLHRYAAETLPAYMIPSAFLLLDALPLSASGKIDRRRLPEPQSARPADRGTEYVAPRNAQEAALVDAWSAVLTAERIGIRDHYIALGGDSIKALRVVSRLRDAGWKLELGDLFLHPHIEDLAPRLTRWEAANPSHDGTGEAPLSPAQRRFFAEYDGALHHFNQYALLQAAEPIDASALRQALHAVYSHHDILRATYTHANGVWTQNIAPAGAEPVFEILEGPLPQLAALQTSLRLETGPLFRAVLHRSPSGERIFLLAHHLLVDGVSWRILVEDLETAYRQARAGQQPSLPPKTTSFKTWASLRQAPPTPAKPANPEPACAQHECGSHTLTLPRDLTAAVLHGCHEAYGTRANDILLAALARALQRFTLSSEVEVLLEGHGRDPVAASVDVSRTVGWFTSFDAILLDLGPTADPGAHIKRVKESLRAMTPARQQPAIAFNYLGEFGETGPSMFSRAEEDAGPMADPAARFHHDISIDGITLDGRLRLHFSYNPHRRLGRQTPAIAAAYRQELETLTRHAASRQGRELTPSDTDYKDFTLDEMENFLQNLPG